ncbi:MAG: hypothetical protein IPK33_33130 [Gemmatimonadetes bacterium]|nr:hypothetical protein [Gemmatimonadota bacterium]
MSGYYASPPLEPWLTEAEQASRLRSYNPYWTHVISYHEWLGYTAQRAAATQHVTRPMRRLFQSGYFSSRGRSTWKRLLEDEGYYDVPPLHGAPPRPDGTPPNAVASAAHPHQAQDGEG